MNEIGEADQLPYTELRANQAQEVAMGAVREKEYSTERKLYLAMPWIARRRRALHRYAPRMEPLQRGARRKTAYRAVSTE